ncbi:MAG: hypothetical protein ACKV0T_01590 [Planctomycetales bacterium]
MQLNPAKPIPANVRLFVGETASNTAMSIHKPTFLHDISPAPVGTSPPDVEVADRPKIEQQLDQLNCRLKSRHCELERHSTVSKITHLGRAWVVTVEHSELDPLSIVSGSERHD